MRILQDQFCLTSLMMLPLTYLLSLVSASLLSALATGHMVDSSWSVQCVVTASVINLVDASNCFSWSTQPGHPSVSRRSEYQLAVMVCGWE